MLRSICGLDCSKCTLKNTCSGCISTNGSPFQSGCVVANCCLNKKCESCGQFFETICNLQKQLISEFHALGIKDMEEITVLHALKGSYINLEYPLLNEKNVKLLDDNKIYLGSQIHKKGSSRCYGIVADEKYLIVCEYGEFGQDAEIVVYQKRNI